MFSYPLSFKLVSATGALLGSTQLMLFKLGIYEIRAAYRTQVVHLIHGGDVLVLFSIFRKEKNPRELDIGIEKIKFCRRSIQELG